MTHTLFHYISFLAALGTPISVQCQNALPPSGDPELHGSAPILGGSGLFFNGPGVFFSLVSPNPLPSQALAGPYVCLTLSHPPRLGERDSTTAGESPICSCKNCLPRGNDLGFARVLFIS